MKGALTMRSRILVIFFSAIVIVLLTSPLFAGKVKRPHPSTLTYPPLNITRPEVVEIALANGLEGFLIEDHELPLVDIELLVKTSFPEPKRYGLNEMAQWVMRNGGTAAWPPDKLNDELEFLAAWVGVSGDDLSTSITLNCLKKDLPRALEIFADLVMNPSFPKDKLEMKRKTMLEDIRRRNDSPDSVAWREFSDLIYHGHPYGLETTRSSVKAITKKDLMAFHRRYFHPNNAIIGISGDVTKKEIVEALNRAFQGWQPADVAIPKVPEIERGEGKSCHYAYMDVNQAYIMVGHLGIHVNNPDRCALNIMSFILGGNFNSWITQKVRSNEGLAYSTGSSFGSDPWTKGLFYAYAQTKADAYSRSLKLIIEQIERMRTEGPTAEEFRKAVDSFLNSQVFKYESKDQVVHRMVYLRFQGRPLDSTERDMETYARLTLADIKRAAREYLHPDKLTVLVVGDAERFDRPLSEFGQVNVITLQKD
jgi:predicted Zn-dependent peptidase